jgi:hypothetical protein
MSSRGEFVLLAGEQRWGVIVRDGKHVNIVDIDATLETGAAAIANAVAAVLKPAGYAGGPVIVALPASMCFCASISTGDLPRGDANALLYRFEEKLPFPAETVVADFITGDDRALGVCVKPQALTPLLDALENAGIDVGVITPAAMLAGQGLAGTDASLLVMGEPFDATQVNLLTRNAGRPTQWATTSDVSAQALLMTGEPVARALVTIDAKDAAAPLGAVLQDAGMATVEAIAHGAAEIFAGRLQPVINFRRGALAARDRLQRHRRPLNALLASAALLFAAITVAGLVRASRYQRLERAADARIRTEFLAQFPNWSGPISVAIVESEHRKSVAAAGNASPIARPSALNTMRDVLSRLPSGGELTLGRMSFGGTSFELEGRVGAYDQIDGLVAAARGAGLNVPPPQTRKEADNAWSFVLRGARSDASARAGGGQ